MRELSFKMVIRAYLICALMTSILGIISCSVHDIINWFPIVLLYAWIILSPISILALITVYLLGVQRDWICKIPLICLCAFIVYFINLNSSESYLINFFATQTVPYDLLYYNNGIEIRVNDTIFSIFTWVLLIISAIWYRRSGRMVPPVSRCRIFHSGDVVPHQISFFDILVHQRV